jgi:hypothetical protein
MEMIPPGKRSPNGASPRWPNWPTGFMAEHIDPKRKGCTESALHLVRVRDVRVRQSHSESESVRACLRYWAQSGYSRHTRECLLSGDMTSRLSLVCRGCEYWSLRGPRTLHLGNANPHKKPGSAGYRHGVVKYAPNPVKTPWGVMSNCCHQTSYGISCM